MVRLICVNWSLRYATIDPHIKSPRLFGRSEVNLSLEETIIVDRAVGNGSETKTLAIELRMPLL